MGQQLFESENKVFNSEIVERGIYRYSPPPHPGIFMICNFFFLLVNIILNESAPAPTFKNDVPCIKQVISCAW